ncbi:4'-phosphopantetheinyl transferase superfamily protein [Microbacterium sp. 18062]|uniref:4'-phosphopantetheinyl transferase family protein n=1 Tax=Microbacterium sp. 18062 TaxID=2681410 RepID=UPI00135B5349|nr:4'-phosphopantetheinyl transferase superfamily protein [Microbacterium sp. 18062]
MTTGLPTLLPAAVEVEQTTVDVPDIALFPQELAAVAGAVPKRRAEFAAVRGCARRALGRLGHAPAPILPGPNREPQWPAGIVGSLTHCDGYRAAALARTRDILTLGIDAETHEPLPDGVAELVTVGDEPRLLARLGAAEPGIAWDRVLFSAKESIYKAWFPLARAWLDFTECELTIDPAGTFAGQLLVSGPRVGDRVIDRFAGRWTIHGRHILTAVWEPATRVAR